MKLSFIILIVFFHSYVSGQSLYTISFPGIEGNSIHLSNYQHKKLMVVAFNACNPDIHQLQVLDSLYQLDSNKVRIIAIPIDDFGNAINTLQLKSMLRDSLHLSFTIASKGKGKKIFGASQHVFLKWLTHVNENLHFDKDITEDGQIFLLSSTGNLFGLFKKSTSINLLHTAINANN